jgi:small subunit ribosomal protein S4
MRQTTAKNKLARKVAIDLGLKTPGSGAHAGLLKRLNVKPGQHGARVKRKVSERGKQLKEKQKLRLLFGLTEGQLKNYFKKAIQIKGNTAIILSNLLEKRLDNVVYRLGYAPTRASARQLVGHRHIKVNDKIVKISSYNVSVAQVIAFAREKSKKIPYVESVLGNKDLIIPKWLEKKGDIGKLSGEPNAEEIEKQIDLRSVIEYYSR